MSPIPLTRSNLFLIFLLSGIISLSTAAKLFPPPSNNVLRESLKQQSTTEPTTTFRSTTIRTTTTAPPTTTVPMTSSQAPTEAVGKFLGTVGFETPQFRKVCRRCCRKTRRLYSDNVEALKNCDKCRLNPDVSPGLGCPLSARLGFGKNPTNCFLSRCHRMLSSAGSCACFTL